MNKLLTVTAALIMIISFSGCAEKDSGAEKIHEQNVPEAVISDMTESSPSPNERPDDNTPLEAFVSDEQPAPILDPVPGLTHGGAVFSRWRAYDSTGKLLKEGSTEYYRAGKPLTEYAGKESDSEIITQFKYDTEEKLTARLCFSGGTVTEITEYRYDESGFLCSYVTSGPEGQVLEEAAVSIESDAAGNPSKKTVSIAGVLREVTDFSNGLPCNKSTFSSDGTLLSQTTYQSTEEGYKATECFENSERKTVIRYDFDGNPIKIIEYDEDGAPSGWTEYVYRFADGTETSGANM